MTTVHGPYDTRIFHKQAKSLQSAGYDVTLLAPVNEPKSRSGIDIIPIGSSLSRIERWSHLYRTYRVARNQEADIYHLHDPELLPIGIVLAQKTDAKTVYDVHEDFSVALRHRNWVPKPLSPLVTSTITSVQATMAKRVDAVVAATEWIEQSFAKYGHPRTATIRNFPRIEAIDVDDIDIEFENEYTLTYVGGLSNRRGLSRMLELTAQLTDDGLDVGLCLVGPFNDPTAEEFTTRFIANNDLEDRVRLTGHIDYESIFSYLHAADIGLVLADPDLYEYVISTKAFEYMYCELPVIATETHSTRKYIPEEAGIKVDAYDRSTLCAVVKDLLLDDQRRTDMGKAGRKAVKEHYSWSVEEQKLLELYQSFT